jgi:chemotaxis protein MotB
MEKINFHHSIFCLLIFVVASCVPTQKFQETEKKYKNCSYELDVTKQKQEQLSVENTEMKQLISKKESQLNSLIKDSLSKANEYQKIQEDFTRVNRQYAELQESQETILKGTAKETAKLMMQLQTTQDDLKKKEEGLKLTDNKLNEKKKSLDNLTLELEKRDARLIELEKILFKKDSIVKSLKTKVSTALMNFDKEELTVKVQNGKVYISLEEKLLFKSGSITVDPKGIEALKNLAKVLEENPDINITIEGHTDNMPYKSGGAIKDNWDLSTLRATSIIRIILQTSKIDPKRLIASGRGEFLPVASNAKSETRSKNRRTEIILTPKLDELFKVLESN